MNKTLLFVESPLQLLNALEAINHFNLTNYKIVVRLSNKKINDKQLIYLVSRFELNNIEYIFIRAENKKPLDYIKLLITKLRYFLIKVDKVFIGNYESGFFKLIMNQFSNKKMILLDDGAKSIFIQKKFSDNNFINMFSIYNLKPYNKQEIFQNEYTFIKDKLEHKSIDKDTILFFGMKLSEYNIIEEAYYIKLINQISQRYNNKQIIYITHRGENKDKLDKISKIKNIIIKDLNYPVELYGLYEESIPHKVSSFYSTALYAMQKIYNIEVESFQFDYQESEYKNQIDEVYEYYSKYFKVIDLDD